MKTETTTPNDTPPIKHTPGPWRVRNHPGQGGIWVDAPEGLVSNNRGPDYPRQILEDDDYPEKEADAQLIAAAPDLLAACMLAAQHHQGSGSIPGKALRAAIDAAMSATSTAKDHE